MDTRLIGDGLRRLRDRQGLSQEKLGETSGLGKNTIKNFESGRTHVTLDAIRPLADGLGVTVAELVTEVGLVEQPFDTQGTDWVAQVGDVRMVPMATGHVSNGILRWVFTGESVYVSATRSPDHMLIGFAVEHPIGDLLPGDVAIVDATEKFPSNGALVVAHRTDGVAPFLAMYRAQDRIRVFYDAQNNMIAAQDAVVDGTVIGFHRSLPH